ncbi:MAG: hypothetical protein EXQ52_15945 [Bryobacterales bacterium]|nr:hypothetical protein [Bryobacterales bacterium]
MKRNLGLSFFAAAVLSAADAYTPTSGEMRQIGERMADLKARVEKLSAARTDDALLADVAVYHKAADWITRHPEEFYTKVYVANTLAALDRGIERAGQLAKGSAPWEKQKGRFSRAYRSKVDGSLQPYGMIVPDSYDGQKPMRLDVVMHGKGATLNEVSFLTAHDAAKPIPPEEDYLQVEVFGRTNNGYRWAGETDVFEALASVQKRYNVDPARIVLRGFSMGGAGTWHIGLHYPDRWVATEAGAGFTDTKVYAKQTDLPPYQDAALRIYDAVDYSLNAVNVPMVGYGGEDDPQRQAAFNIRERLEAEGYHFTAGVLRWTTTDLRALFLAGAKTGHRFHPDSKRESEAFIREAVAKGRSTPERIRFVTYTPRYNKCFWAQVDVLDKMYERTEVYADKNVVKTKNVTRLTVTDGLPYGSITLDGQKFPSPGVYYKTNGVWEQVEPSVGVLVGKVHGRSGPVDDAFMDSFLCVRPTGSPLNSAVNERAKSTLDQFAKEFDKWMRGDIRVKDDTAVTKQDIASSSLILFGDPGSNKLIAQVLAKLPVTWTKDTLTVGGRTYAASAHMPVLICRNPLNPKRSLVLNSGHTFHEKEFAGTNALLYPRLGDYAVIGTGGEVIAAGLFDGDWKVK